MKYLKLICAVLLLAAASNVTANTYYLKNSGNDSNSGLSWANAWASLAKVNTSMGPGDTVYMNGTFRDSLVPVGGSFSDRTAYIGGDGVNANTMLRQGATITRGDTLKNWTNQGGNIYSCDASSIGSVFGVILNDDSLLHPGGGSSPALMSWGQSGNTCYINIGRNPSSDRLMGWPTRHIVEVRDNHGYYTLLGLKISYGEKGIRAFEDTNCDSIFIEQCDLFGFGVPIAKGNNPAAIQMLNGGDTLSAPNYWRIRSCSLSCAWDPMGNGHGSAIVVYDYAHLTIDSNHIRGNFSGSVIEFKGQAVSGVKVDAVIAFNVIDVWEGSNGIVAHWNNQQRNQTYGNLIIGNGALGKGISVGQEGLPGNLARDNKIYNNTIVGCQQGFGSALDPNKHGGYNHQIKYNIFYNCGNEFARLKSADVSDGGGTHYFVDSNLYFNTNGAQNFRFDWTNQSFSQWQSIDNWDPNSTVNVDPGFTDTSLHRFSGYSRPSAGNEMNLSYGGKAWTRYGAVQSVPTTPLLAVSKSSFNFSAVENSSLPANQTFSISNSGINTLNWSISDDASWLVQSPTSGNSNSASITVSVVTTGLTPGTHNATITISSSNAPNAPLTIPVTYVVQSSNPIIALSPTSVSFNAIQNGTTPLAQTLNISNSGLGTLSWSLSHNSSWLALSASSGSGNNSNVALSITSTALVLGTYYDTILVSSSNAGNSPQTVEVSYVVSQEGTAVIRTGPWSSGLTHVPGTGNNRLLVFAVGWEESSSASDKPILSITYGGRQMSFAGRQSQSSWQGVELWYLTEASLQLTTNNNFSVSWATGAPSVTVHYAAGTYDGVDQINSIADFNSSASPDGSSNPLTATLNVVNGALSIAVASHGSGSGSFNWNNGWSLQTGLADAAATSGTADFMETATGNSVVSVTSLASTANRFVLAAMALRPAAGGVTPPDTIPPADINDLTTVTGP